MLTHTLAEIVLEVVLGLGIKLFIENGRIHPMDFVNDYLFWLPGVDAKDGYGLERQVAGLLGPIEAADTTAVATSDTHRASA